MDERSVEHAAIASLTRHAQEGAKETGNDRSQCISQHRFTRRVEVARSLGRFDTLDRSDANRDGRWNRRGQVRTDAIQMREQAANRKRGRICFDYRCRITDFLRCIQRCRPAESSAHDESDQCNGKRAHFD